MKKLNFGFYLLLLSSCGISVPPYHVSPTITLHHNEVMTEDYPTKKSVLLKFGRPTSKETFDNVENWYYKLSEVTNSTSTGLATGLGRIYQDPLNPYLRPGDRALVSSQTQLIKQNTSSTTVETYVKFWFVNDSVSKWETFGVDYSRLIPNPNYDTKRGLAWEQAKLNHAKQTKRIVIGAMTFGVLMFFTLVITGGK